MALQFFRRHQKLVFSIMVILMISFLISGYGLSHVFHSDKGGQPVGASKLGKVRLTDWQMARSDLTLLNVLNQNATDYGFGAVIANRDDAPLAYALLQQEAAKSHVTVTTEDVDAYLLLRGLEGARLEGLVAQLRSMLPGLTQEHLRDAVDRWIRVERLFTRVSFSAGCPARFGAAGSEQQLRHLYRDLMERIDLRIATVKIDDFLRQAPEPNDAELQAQFQAHRELPPGKYSQDNPFGFGYRQPSRATLRYMWIRHDVLERAARPTDEELRAHYIRHRAEYVKAPPAGEGAASAPADPSAGEPMTFSEAKARITEELSGAAVRKAMDDLVAQATVLIDRYATESHATTGDAYAYAVSQMTTSAGPLLSMELLDLNIKAQPLHSAVADLAGKAGLVAIAFPWGQQDGKSPDPNAKVTLTADRITLGEALDSISTQLKCPKFTWAMLTPLPGALFPMADDQVDFFPVQVRDGTPMDIRQMLLDPVLGHSQTSAGEPLARIVFTAQPFQPTGRSSAMKSGDDGPRMVVAGSRPGRLLWRLVGADPDHAPDPNNWQRLPGLKDQVTKDVQSRWAFDHAVQKAKEVQARASKSGLASAAKRAGIDMFQTGPFARRVEVPFLRQYEAMVKLTGQRWSLAELAMQDPLSYALTDVPGLEIQSPDQKQLFMDAAFALAPANVEPPYPSSPPATGILPMPFLGQVLVMERIGYTPVVAAEYAQAKPILAAQTELIGLWRSRMAWFGKASIVQRLEYKDTTAPQAVAQ